MGGSDQPKKERQLGRRQSSIGRVEELLGSLALCGRDVVVVNSLHAARRRRVSEVERSKLEQLGREAGSKKEHGVEDGDGRVFDVLAREAEEGTRSQVSNTERKVRKFWLLL